MVGKFISPFLRLNKFYVITLYPKNSVKEKAIEEIRLCEKKRKKKEKSNKKVHKFLESFKVELKSHEFRLGIMQDFPKRDDASCADKVSVINPEEFLISLVGGPFNFSFPLNSKLGEKSEN